VSYFPNWKVDGMKGYVTPLIVVIPTDTHVHLRRSTGIAASPAR
jgi:hypothetical protein